MINPEITLPLIPLPEGWAWTSGPCGHRKVYGVWGVVVVAFGTATGPAGEHIDVRARAREVEGAANDLRLAAEDAILGDTEVCSVAVADVTR